MYSFSKNVLSSVIDYIVPERCCLCLQLNQGGFCHQCQDLLPWIVSGCSHCGTALVAAGICGQCQQRTRTGRVYYDQVIAPFNYEEPISSYIQRVKYHRALIYVRPLVEMLAMRINKQDDPLPEVLVPVPLYSTRLRQRGYNQAMIIASELSKMLDIPVDSYFVRRVRDTPSQTDLNQVARRQNMRGAFVVDNKRQFQSYNSVAIIDDVITSCATVEAIGVVLKKADIKTVYAWAIAKT